jgi:hypothetical protein
LRTVSLAALAGVVASGRGTFRILPECDSYPYGGTEVAFGFRDGSMLDDLLRRLYPDVQPWVRSDRVGHNKLTLQRAEASAATAELVKICPLLPLTNPEMVPLLAAEQSGVNMEFLRNAYLGLKAGN